MPYKSQKIKLVGLQDRRRKLTEDQRIKIAALYAVGDVGTRPLARQFRVSRKTIQLIVNPDMAIRAKEYTREHWKKYHNKEALTIAIRNLRRYKQGLYLSGQLKETE